MVTNCMESSSRLASSGSTAVKFLSCHRAKKAQTALFSAPRSCAITCPSAQLPSSSGIEKQSPAFHFCLLALPIASLRMQGVFISMTKDTIRRYARP